MSVRGFIKSAAALCALLGGSALVRKQYNGPQDRFEDLDVAVQPVNNIAGHADLPNFVTPHGAVVVDDESLPPFSAPTGTHTRFITIEVTRTPSVQQQIVDAVPTSVAEVVNAYLEGNFWTAIFSNLLAAILTLPLLYQLLHGFFGLFRRRSPSSQPTHQDPSTQTPTNTANVTANDTNSVARLSESIAGLTAHTQTLQTRIDALTSENTEIKARAATNVEQASVSSAAETERAVEDAQAEAKEASDAQAKAHQEELQRAVEDARAEAKEASDAQANAQQEELQKAVAEARAQQAASSTHNELAQGLEKATTELETVQRRHEAITNELAAERAQRQATTNNLATERAQRAREARNAQQSSQQSAEAITNLQNEVEKLKKQLEDATSRESAENDGANQIEKLNSTISQLNDQIRERDQSHDSTISRLTESQNTVQEENKTLSTRAAQLEKENSKLKQQVKTNEEDTHSASAKIASLERTIQELTAEVKNKTGEAEVAITERDSVQEQSRTSAQETARQQTVAVQELESLRATTNDLASQLRASREQRDADNDAHEGYKKHIEQEMRNANSNHERIVADAVQTATTELNRQRDDATRRVAELDETVANYRNTVNNRDNELRTLRADAQHEVLQRDAQITTQGARITQLENMLRAAEHLTTQAQTSAQTAEQQLADARAEIQSLQAAPREEVGDVSMDDSDMSLFLDTPEKASRSASKDAELQQLRERIQALEGENQRLQNSYTGLEKLYNNSTPNDIVDKLRLEIAENHEELESTRRESEDRLETIEILQDAGFAEAADAAHAANVRDMGDGIGVPFQQKVANLLSAAQDPAPAPASQPAPEADADHDYVAEAMGDWLPEYAHMANNAGNRPGPLDLSNIPPLHPSQPNSRSGSPQLSPLGRSIKPMRSPRLIAAAAAAKVKADKAKKEKQEQEKQEYEQAFRDMEQNVEQTLAQTPAPGLVGRRNMEERSRWVEQGHGQDDSGPSSDEDEDDTKMRRGSSTPTPTFLMRSTPQSVAAQMDQGIPPAVGALAPPLPSRRQNEEAIKAELRKKEERERRERDLERRKQEQRKRDEEARKKKKEDADMEEVKQEDDDDREPDAEDEFGNSLYY